MHGKTVVITGATSGIGEVAAIRLAEQGARIVFTARDKARADDTMAALRKANPAADHAMHMADLSRLAEMKRVAGELAREPQIDVLINNAGALFNKRQETADGLEMTFALNHMAYFVITNLLLGKLEARRAHRQRRPPTPIAAPSWISTTCSRARAMSAFPSIPRCKLCNILFNRELARRSRAAGVTANACIPALSPPASATIPAG